MKRIEIALLAGIFVSILLSSYTGFAKECDAVRHEVVRLHILANSDLPKDQELKLAVRDAILTQTASVFEPAVNKEQALQNAQKKIPEMEQIARRTLQDQGSDASVSIRLVNMYFTTRQYEDTRLPAGYYDAVRIEIGEAKGQNWWCVMFPPMCIPAASPDDPTSVEQQIQELGQTPNYVPKLAVVEVFEQLHENWKRMRDGDTTEEIVVAQESSEASKPKMQEKKQDSELPNGKTDEKEKSTKTMRTQQNTIKNK